MRYNIARVCVGLFCMLRAEQLYFEDFSSGSWPAGYSYEGNWIVSDSWAGNDTPPAAVYNWNPQQENFNHNLITDYIDVGDNDAVLVTFGSRNLPHCWSLSPTTRVRKLLNDVSPARDPKSPLSCLLMSQ